MSKRILSSRTKDYDLFTICKDNRSIDIAQVESLVAAMTERNNISALTCIEVEIEGKRKLQIIDGQHRFLALKRLGKEIEYDIWDTQESSMIMLNETQMAWKLIDYLNYGVSQEINDYMEIKKYLQTTGVRLQSLLLIFSRTSIVKNIYAENEIIKDFKKINWRISDLKYGKKILNSIVEFYQDYHVFHYNSHRFICAFIEIIAHPDFDPDRMKSQLKKFSDKLKRQYTIADYIDNFEIVYNKGCPARDFVIFPKSAFEKPKLSF